MLKDIIISRISKYVEDPSLIAFNGYGLNIETIHKDGGLSVSTDAWPEDNYYGEELSLSESQKNYHILRTIIQGMMSSGEVFGEEITPGVTIVKFGPHSHRTLITSDDRAIVFSKFYDKLIKQVSKVLDVTPNTFSPAEAHQEDAKFENCS